MKSKISKAGDTLLVRVSNAIARYSRSDKGTTYVATVVYKTVSEAKKEMAAA